MNEQLTIHDNKILISHTFKANNLSGLSAVEKCTQKAHGQICMFAP